MKTSVWLVAAALAVTPGAALGQRSAASKITGEAYNVHSGSMYTRHAAEHAYMLRAYSANPKALPPGAVQQHAQAVRENVAKAGEALAKVKPLARDKESQKLVQSLEKHYADCNTHCDKLMASGADEKAMADCCNDLVKSLEAAEQEHAKLMKKLGVEPLLKAAK
jgi:hypothetical protein